MQGFRRVVETKAGYETSIEVALGGSISNIITEDEEVAKILLIILEKIS